MSPGAYELAQSDSDNGSPAIHCEACQSAMDSDSQQSMSFLLLDHLTIPTIGCSDHLEQFSSICGLSTEDTADLLDHHPAGGICCPSCRLAPNKSAHPVIPVQDGAIAIMACPNHQSEIVQRFHTGLETTQYLTASFGTNTGSSL